MITANTVAERIRKHRGAAWKSSTADGICAGDPGIFVTGIATTFAPTFDVLRRAVAKGTNLIVSRDLPFWGRPATAPMMRGNPTFAAKQELIEKHKLTIYRLRDNWDGQERALAKALGWERADDASLYPVKPASLESLAKNVSSRLKLHGVRVIGDPKLQVGKVALSHGMITVPDMRKLLDALGIDAAVIGEPVEWEASPYFQDAIASGRKLGLIVIGQEASEEPGCGEMAVWLKSFVQETPVEWLPAGEPFTAGRWL